MCLCNHQDSRVNKVCCRCRVSKKGIRALSDVFPNEKCQFCNAQLIDIGSKIEVPKKNNLRAWSRLAKLISETKYFSVCQCGAENKRKFKR